MSAENDKEAFLSRWSRRKLNAKELPAAAEAAAAQPAAPLPAPPHQAAESAAVGPQQRDSAEYREYFDPRVDEKLRRAALKGLFSDPHFNVMDGLDTYIDDYSIADPIPEAMLRRLNQAKELFLFDDEKQPAVEAGDVASAASGIATAAPSPVAQSVSPAQPSEGATGDEAGAATDASGMVPVDNSRNS